MKICQPHWDQLRRAIDERGMSGLVAGSGEKAAAALERQLNGIDEPADFDPLMNANWAIHGAALKSGGLYLMTVDEQGNQYCPLCEAEKHGSPGTATEWIKRLLRRATGARPRTQTGAGGSVKPPVCIANIPGH